MEWSGGIFLKVRAAVNGLEGRPLGSSNRSPFGAWLYGIAHNHVVSFHRRAASRGPASGLHESVRDERRWDQPTQLDERDAVYGTRHKDDSSATPDRTQDCASSLAKAEGPR